MGSQRVDLTERLSVSTGPKERLTRNAGFTRRLCSFLLLPFAPSSQAAWSQPVPSSPMSLPLCGLWLVQVHLIAPDPLLGCLCTHPESQTWPLSFTSSSVLAPFGWWDFQLLSLLDSSLILLISKSLKWTPLPAALWTLGPHPVLPHLGHGGRVKEETAEK